MPSLSRLHTTAAFKLQVSPNSPPSRVVTGATPIPHTFTSVPHSPAGHCSLEGSVEVQPAPHLPRPGLQAVHDLVAEPFGQEHQQCASQPLGRGEGVRV